MLGSRLTAGMAVHPVSSDLRGCMRKRLVMVVLRLRRSGWGPEPSWEGSRRTEKVAGHCTRHTQDERRTLAGLLVSWKPQVVIRSPGDP